MWFRAGPAGFAAEIGPVGGAMKAKQSDVVSAAEIASWAWCPESWRLDAVGAEPGNRDARARGSAFHRWTAFIEVWSRRAAWAGVLLVAVAVLVVTVWYFFFRGAEW
jgi:hypothetical protein